MKLQEVSDRSLKGFNTNSSRMKSGDSMIFPLNHSVVKHFNVKAGIAHRSQFDVHTEAVYIHHKKFPFGDALFDS